MPTLTLPFRAARLPQAMPARPVVGLPLAVAGAVALFLGLVGLTWVGFLGSDDASYWLGSNGWLRHFPYIGINHWDLRHTLVVPIAAARLLLGDGVAALTLPTLLYGVGLIVLAGAWVGRSAGRLAALFALLLLVTNPQFVLLSSYAFIDVVEAFYVCAAFFLIDMAASRLHLRPARVWTAPVLLRLLAAGACLGLGIMSRETSVFAVAAVVVLFLFGFGGNRLIYVVVGAGTAAVVGAELLWLWVATGSPFYRWTISLHHDSTINRAIDQGAAIPILHPALDPITMVLFNQNFGLVFVVGVPLIAATLLRRRRPAAGSLVAVAGTLAAVWFIAAAALWTLLPLIPRYFLLPSLLVSVLSGVALARLWRSGRPRTAAALCAVVALGNGLAIASDNRDPMSAEHELVELAALPGTPVIHTDPETARRARVLLEWRGAAGRVTSAPAAPGDLLFLNAARPPGFAPQPDWTVVQQHAPHPGPLRSELILAAGALPLPASLQARLRRPLAGDILYRLP